MWRPSGPEGGLDLGEAEAGMPGVLQREKDGSQAPGRWQRVREQARHKQWVGGVRTWVHHGKWEEWAQWVQKNPHFMWLVGPREAVEVLSRGVT